MIKFKAYEKFLRFIEIQIKQKDHLDDIFVIMRKGYSEFELKNAAWSVEILELHDAEYTWLNDFYEGEDWYEVAAVLVADELADIVLNHLYFHIA